MRLGHANRELILELPVIVIQEVGIKLMIAELEALLRPVVREVL
jgi:hypothetical protein